MKELFNAIALRAADDCLDKIGLVRRHSISRVGPALICFGAGALVGGCAAMLLTPCTGQELQTKLQDRARSARRSVQRGDARPATTQRAGHLDAVGD